MSRPTSVFSKKTLRIGLHHLTIDIHLTIAIRYVHRCDKRLQRLQKNRCKRAYYFFNV